MQCNLECAPSERLSTSAVSSFTSHEEVIEPVEALSGHIKSAINMGSWALDNNPTLDFKLMAVTVPNHWDGSARTHVATGTKLAGQPLDGSYMIIPLSRAIQLAFQMSRCTEGKYLTLLLEYNKSYLHMILLEICGTGCIVKRQVYFPHLGEDKLHKAPNCLQNDGKSKDNSTVVPNRFIAKRPICNNKAAHFKPIIDTVSEFMIRITVPKTSSPTVNEEWINVKGDKRDCGAYGATLVARRQLQNPKHLGDWKDLPGYVPPGGCADLLSLD